MGQDAGVTFTLMDSSSAHTDPVTATIDVISRNTIIRVDVDDDAHTGGFIATVDCLGQTYSTLNPITSSNWKMISALSRNLNIEYRTDGSTAWYLAQPGIADDPVIIWIIYLPLHRLQNHHTHHLNIQHHHQHFIQLHIIHRLVRPLIQKRKKRKKMKRKKKLPTKQKKILKQQKRK